MGTVSSVADGEVLTAATRVFAMAAKTPGQSQIDQEQKATRQRELAELKKCLDRCQDFAEILKLARATNYENRNEINARIGNDLRVPYNRFKSREQRLILGDRVTELGLVSLLVDYYMASLDVFNIKAVTCYEDDTEWTTKLSNMRSFFWDYSDASPKFAEQLARSGYLELMMKDLDAIQIGIQNNTLQECNPGTLKAIETAIAPVYNCSKLEITKSTFRELDVMKRIEPYLQSSIEKIQAEATLIRWFIIDEQQNDLLTADETVFTFLINGLKEALGAKDRRFSGLSTSELAEALGVLARHENNKEAIVRHGALPHLVSMLTSTDEEDVKQAIKTLWKLSFDQENKSQIKEVENCIDMVQKLSHHSSDEIKNTASGVLWTLEQNQGQEEEKMEATSNDSEIPSRFPKENNGTEQHIMISYNWEDQKIVLKIKDGLQKLGYNVWMDVERMHGSILEAMGKAVENASVVLVCFSELYKNSDNCRAEAEYAFKLRKPIIPLKMQHRYTPDGWLGALCGTKLYFDFSQEINFNEKLQKLVREIGKKDKVADTPPNKAQQEQKQITRKKQSSGFELVRPCDLTFDAVPIGAGGFGQVYRAHHKDWGDVAVKKALSIVVTKGQKRDLEKEAKILWRINNEYIVQLIGVVMEKCEYALVMNYMSHGSLSEFVRYHEVPFPLQVQMICQIILGMNYLHTRNPAILHLDLKGRNVLVNENFDIKLCDFGLAKWRSCSSSYVTETTKGGTVTHVPPEQWDNINCTPNVKFDVYAFGIVVWEVLARELPFKHANENEKLIKESVLKGQRPDLNKERVRATKDWLRKIMTDSWSQDPERRPTFSDLKGRVYPFLQRYRSQIPAAKRKLSQECEDEASSQDGTSCSFFTSESHPYPGGQHPGGLQPGGQQVRDTGMSSPFNPVQDNQDNILGLSGDNRGDSEVDQWSGGGDQQARSLIYSRHLQTVDAARSSEPDYHSGINMIAGAGLYKTNPLGPVQQNTDDLRLTREITKEDILSQHLGKHWKRLARKLVFSKGEIDIITHDCSVLGLGEMIMEMLNSWKNRESTKATAKALAEALCEIGEAGIAAML